MGLFGLVYEKPASLPVHSLQAQSAYQPVVIGLRPEPLKLSGQSIPAGYLALCDKVGFVPTELKDQAFKQFLFDSEISVYDHDQVKAYLERRAAAASSTVTRQVVLWRGLREKDSTYVSSTGIYQKLVPMRVLVMVDKILGKFPDARFYVSEIVADPDPFMAVTIGTGKMFIFAVWGEPGFSG
jgi:hypothetical protein